MRGDGAFALNFEKQRANPRMLLAERRRGNSCAKDGGAKNQSEVAQSEVPDQAMSDGGQGNRSGLMRHNSDLCRIVGPLCDVLANDPADCDRRIIECKKNMQCTARVMLVQ